MTTNFRFYADQVLSLLTPPPFQLSSDECDPQPGKLLIFFMFNFWFVRYSVYIIFRVIIHVSPEKMLAVVCAT